MDNGLFRRDLYFRLGVIKVKVPPERAQGGYHPACAALPHGVQQEILTGFHRNKPSGRSSPFITPLDRQCPGAENLIERAVLIGRGPRIEADDLGIPEPSSSDRPDSSFSSIPAAGVDFPALERAFERHYIEQALILSGGNESEAARLLNINHHTFRYRRRRLERE